jgi:8-oxo-dGTP diphosphatase
MTETALHSVSVSAVITNDAGQVLMVQRRDNGNWEPPGGVLEPHESILDALRREVREETGLDIEPERLTGVYKNLPRAVVALVFGAHPVAGDLITGSETASVRWMDRRQITALCVDAFAIRITDALDGTNVAVRLHDGTRLLGDTLPLPPSAPLHDSRGSRRRPSH